MTQTYAATYNTATDTRSGPGSTVQRAYSLLGPTFYHYLTGDAAVYGHVLEVHQGITTALRDATTGGYLRAVDTDLRTSHIGNTLDQLNSYLTLLAAQADPADQSALMVQALQTARYLRDAFYDPTAGLMKHFAAQYGFSAKSFWVIDQVAQLTGDAALPQFATDAAKRMLTEAHQSATGAPGPRIAPLTEHRARRRIGGVPCDGGSRTSGRKGGRAGLLDAAICRRWG